MGGLACHRHSPGTIPEGGGSSPKLSWEQAQVSGDSGLLSLVSWAWQRGLLRSSVIIHFLLFSSFSQTHWSGGLGWVRGACVTWRFIVVVL